MSADISSADLRAGGAYRCLALDQRLALWLTDALDRISKGHPINRIDELLPWVWKAAQSSDQHVD